MDHFFKIIDWKEGEHPVTLGYYRNSVTAQTALRLYVDRMYGIVPEVNETRALYDGGIVMIKLECFED